MHLVPLTESKGSRAGGRSIEEVPLCCRRWPAGMVWSKARSATEGVDMFDFASAWVEEGESVEVKGVAFIEGPADVAVATGNAGALNSEEDELACELAEPPVLGMSPGDDPLSSACGCVGSEEEEMFWQGRARSFVSASVTTADSCAVSTAWTPRFDRSRSARPWTSVLNFGALGKNCAKLTPGGGRVIVSTSSCYLMHRGVIMIPRSVTGKVYHA